MEEVTKDSAGLVTLDSKGKPPQRRFKDAGDCSEFVQNMISANMARADMTRKAQGQRDGNAPYKWDDLKRAGQLNRTNVNTMEADAYCASGVTPFYDLFSANKHPIYCKTSFGMPSERETFNQIMSEKLHDCVIKKWRAWHNQWWPSLNDYVWHGRAWMMFMDDEDWRFKWVEQDRVILPDGTSIDVEDWETVTVLQDLPIHRLWDKVRGTTVKGWNKEAVTSAIRNAMPTDPTNQPVDAQRVLNEKSFFFNEGKVCTIQLANVFVKEFSGKWSHLIVLQPLTGNPGNQSPKLPPQYLYDGFEDYDAVEKFISPFLFDVTHRNVNECAGMAKKSYGLLKLNDRTFCAQMEGTFLRLGLVLQPQNASSAQKMSLVQIGAISWLPPGCSVQNSTIMSDIRAAVESRNDIRNILGGNLGVFRPQPEKAEGNPPTATEYAGRQQQAMILSSSAVDRYYDQLDHHYSQFFSRVVACSKKSGKGESYKLAKEFKDACLEAGVPKEAFDNIEGAEANRAVGNGSVQVRQQTMATIFPASQQFPEDGRQRFLQDFIAAFAGQTKVDRWCPSREIPNQDQSIAMLENAAMKIGAPVLREPSQNDVIHTQIHMKAMADGFQSLQQGGNPQEVLAFAEQVMPHVLQHLQGIQKDETRADAFKMLLQQWKQMAGMVDKLKAQIMQAQKQRQEQQATQQQVEAVTQGTDPAIQLKAAETQAKLQLAAKKQETQMGMKQKLADQKLQIADVTAAADLRRKHAAAELDKTIKSSKTQNTI